MDQYNILLIEDDRKTAELVRLYLQRAGHHVRLRRDGRAGLDEARRKMPDLIVLDLMLPQIDGLDVCHFLRQEYEPPGVPIIMLTARSTEDDKLLGLELGADDYITKPFSPRELVGRVAALLRRTGKTAEQVKILQADGLSVNLESHEVTRDGQPVILTPKEFQLLSTLMKAPEHIFSRQELLDKSFGYDYDGQSRTVDVHILKLRKKLASQPGEAGYIRTVYGFGYQFGPAVAT